MKVSLDLSYTQGRFVRSTAEIVGLIGPQGEGKTFAGGAKIILHASKLPARERLRGAIIRDTGPNLEQHTIVSLRKAFGQFTRFKVLRSGGWLWVGPRFEAVMFGIDNPAALSRLQGLEVDFIWAEEPAPIISGPSAGLIEEVFTIGYGRLWRDSRRSKVIMPWYQVTMNPADEKHWTHKWLVESPMPGHEEGRPGTEVFNIQRGENIHASETDRERVRSAYRDRPDLLRRYDKGEWGTVQVGVAVTPEYNESLHRASGKLDPIPGLRHCFRFWDGWHNPVCIFAQRSPRGRVLILDVIMGKNVGVRQSIDQQIRGLIKTRYAGITEWEDYGDETMSTPDQSNREESAARAIEDELGAVFRPVSNEWNMRRESMKNILSASIDSDRMVLVSRHEKILHDALSGGYHYPKNPSGVVGNKPVKDLHSHPGDAFSYLAVTLHPMAVSWPITGDAMVRQSRNRAKSYASRR